MEGGGGDGPMEQGQGPAVWEGSDLILRPQRWWETLRNVWLGDRVSPDEQQAERDCRRGVMSAAGLTLLVAACVLSSARQTRARNDAPCQPSKWNNGYNTFVKRHIRSGFPASRDAGEWGRYIKNNGGCDRPTQSFLDPRDLERVRAVCTSNGGKVFEDNLCISSEPFSFVTVRSEPGTCGVRNVVRESKHLILACEVLENRCLPVHFEGNPKSVKPGNNARGCRDPDTRADATRPKMTWPWLLSAMFVVMCLI
ncbi:uncharacterized protein LOC144021756 [Festucalex cinctus]